MSAAMHEWPLPQWANLQPILLIRGGLGAQVVLEFPTFAGVQCNSDINNGNNIISINTFKHACMHTAHTHTDTHTS